MGRAGGGAEASRGPGLLPHKGAGRGATRWRASPTSTGPAPRPTTVFFMGVWRAFAALQLWPSDGSGAPRFAPRFFDFLLTSSVT